jgi:hypothetical protein
MRASVSALRVSLKTFKCTVFRLPLRSMRSNLIFLFLRLRIHQVFSSARRFQKRRSITGEKLRGSVVTYECVHRSCGLFWHAAGALNIICYHRGITMLDDRHTGDNRMFPFSIDECLRDLNEANFLHANNRNSIPLFPTADVRRPPFRLKLSSHHSSDRPSPRTRHLRHRIRVVDASRCIYGTTQFQMTPRRPLRKMTLRRTLQQPKSEVANLQVIVDNGIDLELARSG